MEMVRQGLPAKASNLMGSEWLKEIGMGTTSDVQKQYIRMAQEGELSKTISSLSEVSNATVHISDSNDSPFVTDNTPSSASIVVDLKPNTQLSNDEVMGIANLVAKSVKGLDVKIVVVSDGTGAMLWDGGSAHIGGSSDSTTKIAEESRYSEKMRRDLQNRLDFMLGTGKSVVEVNAELNFDQVHIQDTQNTKGPVINNTESSENYTGAGVPGAGGIAGTSSNTPGGAANTYRNATGATGTGTYSKSDTSQTFAPSVTNRDVNQAPGQVQRLNVAVMVDSSVPAATISSIQSYLSTAVGVIPNDPTRAVTVQTAPFSTALASADAARQKAAETQARNNLMAQIAAVALVAFILLFLYSRQKKAAVINREIQLRALESAQARGLLPDGQSVGSMETLLAEPPLTIDDVLGEMPEARPRKSITAPEIEEQQDLKLESIRDMIRSHPEAVALLMKGWISSDGGL
jgi:flagellar M-ring protein FliF